MYGLPDEAYLAIIIAILWSVVLCKTLNAVVNDYPWIRPFVRKYEQFKHYLMDNFTGNPY